MSEASILSRPRNAYDLVRRSMLFPLLAGMAPVLTMSPETDGTPATEEFG